MKTCVGLASSSGFGGENATWGTLGSDRSVERR